MSQPSSVSEVSSALPGFISYADEFIFVATISVAKFLNSFIKDVICFLETVLQFGTISAHNSKGVFSMGNILFYFLMAG